MATGSFDATFLNIPIRALVIDNEVYPVVTREASIIREVNAHDVVEIDLLIAGQLTTSGKARIPFDATLPNGGEREVVVQSLVGKPISFVYGVSPETEQFLGYVTGLTPDNSFTQGLSFKIRMIGASVVMQRVVPRFESKKTTGQAVSLRVNSRGLGFFGDTHPYVWPAIAQTSETDWEKCVNLASTVGYALFTWGAVVRMHNPIDLFKQHVYKTLTRSEDILESGRNLLDFSADEKSDDLLDRQGLEMHFFDNSRNVVSTKQPLKGAKPKWVPFTSNPVDDQQMAEAVLTGYSLNMARWNQHARARIRGDAALYPGMIVNVESAEGPYNGRWLVIRVEHKMNRESFQTDVSLIRRTVVPAATQPSFAHFWSPTGKGKPAAFLRDEEWFSSWADSTAMMASV